MLIPEELKRVREPVAWVLLAAAAINVVTGIMDALDSSWSLASLGVPGGGRGPGAGFAERALAGGGDVTSFGAAVLPVLAVILATLAGEKVSRAIQITRAATGLQGAALLLGAIYWLAALGAHVDPAVTARFFVQGFAGLGVSAAGLFFLLHVAGLPEMQPEKGHQPAAYPGFGNQPMASAWGYAPETPNRDTAVLALPPPAAPKETPAERLAAQPAEPQPTSHQGAIQRAAMEQIAMQQAAGRRAVMRQAAARPAAAQPAPGEQPASPILEDHQVLNQGAPPPGYLQQPGAYGYAAYAGDQRAPFRDYGPGYRQSGSGPAPAPVPQHPAVPQYPAAPQAYAQDQPGGPGYGPPEYGAPVARGGEAHTQPFAAPQPGSYGPAPYLPPDYSRGGYDQPGHGLGRSRPRGNTQPGYDEGRRQAMPQPQEEWGRALGSTEPEPDDEQRGWRDRGAFAPEPPPRSYEQYYQQARQVLASYQSSDQYGDSHQPPAHGDGGHPLGRGPHGGAHDPRRRQGDR